jgi:V/A-type H+/Na+-transporting ATPase subunit G/H
MEKVWEELKKIEAQADKIRNEAVDESKNISNLARQEARKLLFNSKTYAEQEAKQLFEEAITEANRNREEQLKANKETAEKIRVQAEKKMDQAADAVVNAVLEDSTS